MLHPAGVRTPLEIMCVVAEANCNYRPSLVTAEGISARRSLNTIL